MINPMAFWMNKNELYSQPPADEAQRVAKIQQWLDTPGSAADYGPGSRLAYGALTAAPRAVEGLGQTAASLAHWAGLSDEGGSPFLPQLPPGRTTGESLADMASGLMPLAMELPLMGGPISALSRATGLARVAPMATRALTQAAEFGGLAAQGGDKTTALEQAGEGGLAGIITAAMPHGVARTVASAGLGLASKMFADRNGGTPVAGDWTAGDIQGMAMGLTTAFIGKPTPKWTTPVVGEIPKMAAPLDPTKSPVPYKPYGNPQLDAYMFPQSGRSGAQAAQDMQAAFGFDPAVTNVDSNIIPPKSAQLSAQELMGAGVGRIPEMRDPLHELQAMQLTNRGDMSAEQIAKMQYMPQLGPDVPLLGYGGNDNPMAPIYDMHAPQTPEQLVQRTPIGVGQSPSGMYYQKKAPAIPMEGPVYANPELAPNYFTQQLFNPANQPAIESAAFGARPIRDVDLAHQSQMTLQALQTDWFAQDVLQANRQQQHNLMNWMSGLEAKQTVPEILNTSPIARLAKSPNIPVEDLATELRAYSPAERVELGQAVGVDPTDTRALAQALKEHYDPSLRPRTPPSVRVNEADMYALLSGEAPNPNLSPAEQAARFKFKAQGGYADPAMLYAGARGIVGAGAGYASTDDTMSEGEKFLVAAAIGSAAMFAPAIVRSLGRTGEAEVKIPTWGGRQVQRTHLSSEPPSHHGNSPRLNELQQAEWDKAAAINDIATLQRLQNESTVKGKTSPIPEYMRREGGTFLSPGGTSRPGDVTFINPYDGKPRIEINDNVNTRWLENGDKKLFQKPLSEVLDHPELYDRIPELKKIQVGVLIKEGKPASAKFMHPIDGDFGPMGRIMIINPKDAHDFRVKVLHEVQHAIQEHQGLPGGTTPQAAGTYSAYRRAPGEIEAHTVDGLYDARDWAANPRPGVERIGGIRATDTPVQALEKTGAYAGAQKLSSGMRTKQGPIDLGGFSAPEMSAAMGRAAIGGLVGGSAGSAVDDPGSHTGMAAGAITGALLSFFGPMILKRMLAENAVAKSPNLTSTPTTGETIATTAGVQKFSLSAMLAQARMAVEHPSVLDRAPTIKERALARLENWTSANVGPKFGRILNQASGPVSYLTNEIDEAFKKLAFIQADDVMRTNTTAFLDGTMDKAAYQQAMSIDPKYKAYADFATVAKDSMVGLKEIIARGVGNADRAQMLKTTDNYLTRSYRMFVDKSYSPSVDSINTLANKLESTGAWKDSMTGVPPSLDEIKSRLNQYVHEVQQSRGVYKPDMGKKIDQSAFSHRKNVDPEWAQFLGEITDPQDRIRLTVLKLKPMAEASNFMHQVANGLTLSDEGLRFTFSSSGELEAARQSTLQRLQADPTNQLLRKQLLELQQYRFVENDPRNGMLQGQQVHRNVYDVMNEWGQSSKLDSAAGRALVGINQFMKSNVTYRNPMGIIRQALTTPFFLQAGRGMAGVPEAWNVLIKDSNPAMKKELMENGILNVDTITKDVLRDVDHLSNGVIARSGSNGKAFLGRIDSALATAGAAGRVADSKMADLFKLPDNFNRVAIYLAAKTRFAEQLGAALDSPEVINKAVEHTNRYSMNYSLLPKATMVGRNVPFVNMFISYASEMGRILKNLGEDMVSSQTPGDQRFNAIMSLGTMVALPSAMQSLSESSLSPSDKKEWEKVKAGMPVYAKDRFYIVQGRDKATGKFRVYDISKLLPADQFQQTARALTEGRAMDAVKNNPVVGWDNNPALNIAAALTYGEDRVTGRKLRGPSDYIATVAKEVGGPFTPGEGSMVRRYHQAFDENADGTRGLVDKRGRQLSPSDFWMDTLAQVRSSNIDPKTIEASVASEYKQSVANEMSYANDILKSNQPKEVKDKAVQRTKEALKQIQDRFNMQMGISPTAG